MQINLRTFDALLQKMYFHLDHFLVKVSLYLQYVVIRNDSKGVRMRWRKLDTVRPNYKHYLSYWVLKMSLP